MKINYQLFTAAIFLAIFNASIDTNGIKAQSILFQEDFETSPVTSIVNAYGGTLPDGAPACERASRGNTADFNSSNVDFNSGQNPTYFLGTNPESPCGGYYRAYLESDTLDLTGVDSLYFKCRYFIGSELGWGGAGITIEFNNGGTVTTLDTIFSTTGSWAQVEVALPEAMISPALLITITMGGGEGVGLDDIVIQDGKTVFCAETTNTINPVACDSYVSPSGKYIWTRTNIYTDTIPNTAGCDSVITVNLTVNNSTSDTITEIACDSYEFGDSVLTSSGVYEGIFTNSLGCDSTVTLELTILETTSSEASVTACESYTWNGTVYTTSGTYGAVLTNAAGCDSLVTLNLTILDPSEGKCDTAVTITGVEYTKPGKVFPNPVEGDFSIDLGKSYTHVTMQVRSLSGLLIKSETYHDTSFINATLDAPAGVYILLVQDEKQKQFMNQKLIRK